MGDERSNAKSLCVSASRDDKSGDIILKVVNADFNPVDAKIDLKGAVKLTGTGKIILLSSDSPLDENTLDEPAKVSPKTETVKFSGSSLTRSFPENSFTVIRIPVTGGK